MRQLRARRERRRRTKRGKMKSKSHLDVVDESRVVVGSVGVDETLLAVREGEGRVTDASV